MDGRGSTGRQMRELVTRAADLQEHSRRMRREAEETRKRIEMLAKELENLRIQDLLIEARRLPRLIADPAASETAAAE